MRLALAGLLIVVACLPGSVERSPLASPDQAGGLGGYGGGICRPTTSADASGVVTTTGRFGVVGATDLSERSLPDRLVVAWRGGGPSVDLTVRAESLAPSSASWVEWRAVAGARPSPWGADLGYELGLKPIGEGCWRLGPVGGQPQDAIVLRIRP